MKQKLLAAAAALLLGSFAANAQEIKKDTWFLSGQGGVSLSTGDLDFGKNNAPQASVSFGKYFNPVLGIRLTAQGWQGRGAKELGSNMARSFYQGSILVDGLANISQAIKPSDTRLFDVSALVGAGFNRNFTYNSNSFIARAGLLGQFHVTPALSLDVEATANGVSDRWNRLDDHSFDMFFNLGVGFTYRIGSGYKCKNCKPVVVYNDLEECCEQPVVQTQIVTDTIVVRDTVYVEITPPETAIEELPQACIFFTRAKSDISAEESANIRNLINEVNGRSVTYLVVGYADKGTGSAAMNKKYSQQRAEKIAAVLNNVYGIAKEDIKVDSKGDSEQPFAENDKNRVVIITVEKK